MGLAPEEVLEPDGAVLRGGLTVTALVPAHNEAGSIGLTVRSIARQTYPVRIIVIDDSSTDGTGQEALEAGAQVIRTEYKSKGKNLNEGFRLVKTDLVLCVDADTELAPDCLSEMVTTIEQGFDGTCAAVLPKQQNGFLVRSRHVQYIVARNWTKRVQLTLKKIYVLSGCGALYRVEAVRAVGGFAEVALSEDTHLTWRLQGAGYRVGFTRSAVAYTLEPESFMVYHRQIMRWFSGNAQVIAMYRGQLWHPGRFLIAATAIWDTVTLSFYWPFVIWLQLTHGIRYAGFVGIWGVLLNTFMFFFVVRYMGFREAVKSYPCNVIIGTYTRYVYGWCLFREWVLGRHYASWTGRQGRKTVITPMTRRRKIGLIGVSILALEVAAVILLR